MVVSMIVEIEFAYTLIFYLIIEPAYCHIPLRKKQLAKLFTKDLSVVKSKSIVLFMNPQF